MIIEKEQTSCVRLYNDADFKNLKKAKEFMDKAKEKAMEPKVSAFYRIVLYSNNRRNWIKAHGR